MLIVESVADKNIRVSFHFHPMIYYAGWEKDYPALAIRVQENFSPEEVLFISFGSVTFIKPVLKAIRERGWKTKIHQMPFVKDPKGKLTYRDPVKIEMFRTMVESFFPWHEKVFFYLCMEKAAIWRETFDFAYPNNTVFESDFAAKTMSKL